MNGSQGALRACTHNGPDCTEISATKSQETSGLIRGGNKVNRRQQSFNGCARTAPRPSGVRSHEVHLFPNTRLQAPLESSPCNAGASDSRGDLELALIGKSRFWACCLWPFIFVRPEHRSDIALIEHELVHYREQAWITPVWIFFYLASRQFRLLAEVRAYTRQIELGAVTRDQAARALLSYRLGITFEKAMQALA